MSRTSSCSLVSAVSPNGIIVEVLLLPVWYELTIRSNVDFVTLSPFLILRVYKHWLTPAVCGQISIDALPSEDSTDPNVAAYIDQLVIIRHAVIQILKRKYQCLNTRLVQERAFSHQ